MANQQIDPTILMQFFDVKLTIVLVVLWGIGFLLKKSTSVKDKWIIAIVSVAAVVLAFLILGLTVQAFMQGVIAAALAVYGNQWVKQAKKDE